MKKEQSLVKTNDGKISKFIRFLKGIFIKSNKQDNVVQNEQVEIKISSPLDDVETLKLIMQDKIDIETLDDDTKKRLIVLCQYRLDKVKVKIKDKEKELMDMKNILKEIEDSN